MMGAGEWGATAHDWMVTEDLTGVGVFVIRFNKEEKDLEDLGIEQSKKRV